MLHLAVAAAASFNLVCSGTATRTDYHGSRSEAYTSIYRVDTTSKRWCVGADDTCKVPEQLAAINDASIQFIRTEKDTEREYFYYVDQVSRETGRHQSLQISGRGAGIINLKQEGQCEVASFSGFPKINPKF